MVKILDGKKLAERLYKKLQKDIEKKRLKITLGVILVGDNPVSKIFVNQKKKACEKIGIKFQLFKFPSNIRTPELKGKIQKIVRGTTNSGIIIQLPLPKKFYPEEFLNLIPEKKDIDVLSEESLGKFYQGTLPILPPTVAGILHLFKKYRINIKGKYIIIIGAGRLVGFPLAIQLLKEKATLSVLNKWTRDALFFIKKADILISAAGKPNLIKGSMVKKGVIVIDAGTSMKKGKPRKRPEVLRGRLVGDVDFKSVSKKASYITPVPGGVGPLTVAFLLENLVKLNGSKT